MTDQPTTQIDRLGAALSEAAMRAAADYINGRDVDVDVLIDHLRAEIRIAIGPAFEDGREAYAAGMNQLIAPTVMAGVRLAGIRAAKLALGSSHGKLRS